jgi:hypothetical protein
LSGLPSATECLASSITAEECGWHKPREYVAADGTNLGSFPVFQLALGDKEYHFFRHPDKYITPSVMNWWREYKYYDGNHSVVPYHQRHACWVEALELFESTLGMVKNGNNKA